MRQEQLQNLRWVCTFGDVVFIVGAVAMASQVVLGLLAGKREPVLPAGALAARVREVLLR